MMPALTKPITITVTAPELWMAAVPTVPMPTPISLFLEALAKRLFNLSELADSRLELIIWQATRKIAIPARSVKIAERIAVNAITVVL